MNKQEITKAHMHFLKEEMDLWRREGLIEEDTASAILECYSVRTLNFVKVVLTIGALLVGLGILSFIASNWAIMSKLAKFTVIIGFYAVVNGLGYKMMEKYPKTGRSLIYLGCLIYGAGIFLIGQMFNLGGGFQDAFLLWGAGLLPMAWLYRDMIIYIAAQILLLVFVIGCYEFGWWNLWIFVVIPALYLINAQMGQTRVGTFFNNLVLYAGVGYVLMKMDVSGLVAATVFLILGAAMYMVKLPFNREIFKFQGSLCFGIAGLFLTGKDLWSHYAVFGDGIAVSIAFAVLFVVLLLGYVRNGNLVALVFVCGTILRFYFDTFFDFMPKSFFFIIGGLILLGFGFYFERMRGRKGGVLNE